MALCFLYCSWTSYKIFIISKKGLRVTEPTGWTRPVRLSSPTVNLTYWVPSPNHIPKCHVHMSLNYLQGWGFHQFPGQPVPTRNHPPFKEILLGIQPKPLLAWLEAISLHPNSCHLRKCTNALLAAISFQVTSCRVLWCLPSTFSGPSSLRCPEIPLFQVFSSVLLLFSKLNPDIQYLSRTDGPKSAHNISGAVSPVTLRISFLFKLRLLFKAVYWLLSRLSVYAFGLGLIVSYFVIDLT